MHYLHKGPVIRISDALIDLPQTWRCRPLLGCPRLSIGSPRTLLAGGPGTPASASCRLDVWRQRPRRSPLVLAWTPLAAPWSPVERIEFRMTSWHANVFHITGLSLGESTVPVKFPHKQPSIWRSSDVFCVGSQQAVEQTLAFSVTWNMWTDARVTWP